MGQNRLKCVRCETDVDLDYGYDAEYEGVCNYCGLTYLLTLPSDEEKQYYHFYNKNGVEAGIWTEPHGGSIKCPVCEGYATITGNFNRNEILGDVENEEEDSMTEEYDCQNCGMHLSIIGCKGE